MYLYIAIAVTYLSPLQRDVYIRQHVKPREPIRTGPVYLYIYYNK